MYSRKENKMARNHDSFDMDKWSKGKTKPEKKEKGDLKDRTTRIILVFSIAAILVVAILIVAGVSLFTEIDRQNNTPIRISMDNFPKLKYYVGEEADYTGLSVAVNKYNGTVEYVEYSAANASDFTFIGFDSTRPFDDQIITVVYKGFSCTYHITVKEVPKPKPTLVGITIEVMPKTQYKVGEWLDTDGGMLLKHYSDGTTERTILVNNYISDGWDEAWAGGPGTYTLTVKYKEEGSKSVKITYEIIITE